MTNKISSLPAHNDPMPLHRYGGRVIAGNELQVSYAADTYDVEGNGTVSRLPVMPEGTIYFLRILGNPTFKSSINLVCMNGVDYSASSGDLCIVRSDGNGTWRIFPIPVSGTIVTQAVLSLTSAQQNLAATNLGIARAIRLQKFTASGTYTPDPHLLYATIECVGGGGGGAGCINNASGQGGGGGGGAGSYSRKTVSAATVGASQTVTIGAAGAAGAATTPWVGGAGGDTSVGTLCIGKGGSGGGSNSGFSGTGGAGGVAGTGDLTGVGEAGGSGVSTAVNTLSIPSAFGGSSMFGGGGSETVGNATTSGTGAAGFGSGGGGGNSFNNGGAAIGGTGAQGVVIVTEYCSQ